MVAIIRLGMMSIFMFLLNSLAKAGSNLQNFRFSSKILAYKICENFRNGRMFLVR